MKKLFEKKPLARKDSRSSAGGDSLRGSGRVFGSSRLTGKHAGKTPSKFQFDLIVEAVRGFKEQGTYAVKWTRGVKVASTKPKTFAPPKPKAPLPLNQKLTLLCTLYRANPSNPFDEKDSKLSVMSIEGGKEKSLGKVHFNLAEFSGVPSATTKKILKLSGDFSVQVTIICSYMGTGGSGPGSKGASSLSGLSYASSGDGSTNDGLSDLSDEPSASRKAAGVSSSGTASTPRGAQVNFPIASRSSSSQSESALAQQNERLKQTVEELQSASAQYQQRAQAAEQEASVLRVQAGGMGDRQSSSEAKKLVSLTRELDAVKAERDSLRQERDQFKRERDASMANDSSTMLVSLQKSQESLIRESEILRKQNEELMSQLDDLEEEKEKLSFQLQRSGSSGSAAAGTSDELVSGLKNKIVAKDAEILLLNRKLLDLEKKASTEAAARSANVAQVGEVATLQSQVKELEAETAGAKAKVKKLESHTEKTKKAYEDLTEMYNKIRKDYMVLQAKYKKKSNDLAKDASKSGDLSMEEKLKELADAVSREVEAKEALQRVETEKVELEKKNLELSQTVGTLQEDIELLKSKNSNADSSVEELRKDLESSQKELQTALDNVQRLTEEADASFEQFADSKRELEARCEELKEERDNAAGEVERLRKRRGMETENLKRDLDRQREEMEKLRKKKNEELEIVMEERDNAIEQIDRLKRDHERRLRDLEDEIDSRATGSDLEQNLKTAEIQLAAARSREKNLDDQLTKVRTTLERKESLVLNLESRLRDAESKSSLGAASSRSIPAANGGADEELVTQLIDAKVRLADAEEEILKYKNMVRKIRDGKHKQVLERIAEHASSLEVKLSEARNELAKYRAADPTRSVGQSHGVD